MQVRNKSNMLLKLKKLNKRATNNKNIYIRKKRNTKDRR